MILTPLNSAQETSDVHSQAKGDIFKHVNTEAVILVVSDHDGTLRHASLTGWLWPLSALKKAGWRKITIHEVKFTYDREAP